MRIPRPRHGTVIAYAALFFALTGTAYAASGVLPSARSTTAAGNPSLPARYVPVSAGSNGMTNGSALRTALKVTSTPQVILLSPGNYNLGSAAISVPAKDSIVGAGRQQSVITTTGGITVSPGSDLRELGIKAQGTNVNGLDVTGSSTGEVRLNDVSITDTASGSDTFGIRTDEGNVTADNVSLTVPTGAFFTDGGLIVFRDGDVSATGAGEFGGDTGADFPRIVGTDVSHAFAQSVTADGDAYCSGDYSIDTAGNFTAITDGGC